MRRKVLVMTCGLLASVLMIVAGGSFDEASAMPPYPGLAQKSPAMAASVAKYEELRRGFAARGIDQPGGGLAAGAQLAGDFNMLAICVKFSDHPSSVPASDFDDLIFSQSGSSLFPAMPG